MNKISIFLRKFRFFKKISIFEEYFDFWRIFRFCKKILIFWRKVRFLKKVSIFDQNFDFWRKFEDFWRKGLTANSVQLYCSRKARPEKCKFRIHLKMISVFDPVLLGFYDTNNFVTKYNVSFTHICEGFSSEHEAKRSLQLFWKYLFLICEILIIWNL